MLDIKGMSVLVTGGGSGIGSGTAGYFVERGARVTICGRRPEKLQQVAADLGEDCHWITGDITQAADRSRIMDAAIEHGRGLGLLVNNAGNMLRGPITELREAEVLEVFHANVVAAMMMTALGVPHLERTGGAVIFLGSVHTRRAYPGASTYAASKGAVEVLARVLAAELGPKKIRVGCVLPGAVATEINVRAGLCTAEELEARMRSIESSHVLGRIGTETEVAEAIAYLACAEWTTGASLVVDGGLALGVSGY